MLDIWAYTLGSVIIVSLLSLIGILTVSFKDKFLHKALLYMVSFSAGALFGDVFIHLLPELVEEFGWTLEISIYILLGIIISFIIEQIIQWRHCHVHHHKHEKNYHPFAIVNLVGDTLHNFIDGIIIGASYLISIPVGIATTVAVIFHEIPQEIGDFAIFVHGGFSKVKALWVNFLTALTSIVGAVLALMLGAAIEGFTPILVAIAAGNFIYIAGSDLIPEIHKEEDGLKSFALLIAFTLGILVMLGLIFLE
tara:strand:+ start:514 stop:1269 length:756 start_codon:yes stop_codon:yes gene_type:complete